MPPAKLERCVKKVRASGKEKNSAYAICTAQMKKNKKKRGSRR